jgi:adhesin HecA-like repeat protein
MAYPTISAPYGLKPVNLIGGQVYAGSTRLMAIASGEGTSIFFGDAVKLSGGYITRDPADSAMTPVGVFMGCTYTDPNSNQKVFKQYFPAGTVAADIKAYVVDDYDALFKVAVVSGTTVISGVTQAAVGLNAALVDNTGSTITGDSAVAISATTATNGALPVRIVDVVPDTANSLGSYTEVIVKWNFGMHQYQNAVGA